MKQILQVKYGAQSRNAEHYQLFSGLLAIVTEEFATTYKLTPFRTAFATSFAKENRPICRIRRTKGRKRSRRRTRRATAASGFSSGMWRSAS